MRSIGRLLLVLSFAGALPTLLHAQFQEPTSEELKMTSDPAAPGADAVYLYREEKTDDMLHYHSYYSRIKILTEKGKELATVQIPYEHGKFQVAAIQGRTIHPDGTIIPLTTKPSDLLDFKNSGHQFNTMVFTLPGAEVGSILEYRLQIRYSEDTVSSPDWIVQQPYFIHKEHFFFNPDYNNGHTITNERGEVQDGLMYSYRLGPGQQVIHDSQNRYSLDVTDVQALPDDDWMPPLNAVQWSVVFYYTSSSNGDDFWQTEGKHWAKEVEHFADPSGTLKKAVSDIVGPSDTDEIKARKIYAAVMKLDNRDFGGSGSGNASSKGVKDATGVWKQQGGSSDQLALLYVALARAAGLKTWPMQVVDRDRATFDSSYLSMSQLDDFIAITEIDGKEVYLDPGQKMCPFGILDWKHELASGMRLTAKGTAIADTPAGPATAADIQRSADLTIDDHGNVSGTVRLVMSGQNALYWRQLSLQADAGEVAKQFNEWLRAPLPAGVRADFDHFDGLADYESNLVATAKISGTIGSMTGTRLILPGLFFQSRGKHPFVAQASRTVPIDLHYAKMEQDDVTYHLPASFTAENTPRPVNVEWTGHALMTVRYSLKDNSAHVTRSFVLNSALLEAFYYTSLRVFYMDVSDADQQQLVLDRAKSDSGK